MSNKKYNTTRIKARNFLTNTAYSQLKNDDFANANFILDVFILLVQNTNVFPVDRKFSSQNDQQMIYMLWEKCVPSSFYKFLCQTKNFMYMNGLEVLHPKVTEIVMQYLKSDPKSIEEFIVYFNKFQQIYQYACSMLFVKFSVQNQKCGIDSRAFFMLHFKDWQDKKRRRKDIGKSAEAYVARREEDINEFKQKLINPDEQSKLQYPYVKAMKN